MGKLLIGNIKGPEGPEGPRGPQGIPGPQGPTGIVDSNSTVEFEEAKTRQPLESGNSIAVLFGKIKKFFSDIKETAFLPVVNDLETARPGEGVLDAYQGNVLLSEMIGKDNVLDEESTEANTTPNKYVSDAMVTKELLLRQNGVQWLLDEDTGAIKGYKTKAGADTVFPFSLGKLSYVSSYNRYSELNIENAIIGKKYLISGYMSNVSGSTSINKITGAEIIIENNLVSTIYRYGDYYQFAALAVVKATDTTVNLSYKANGGACFLVYRID